MSLVHGWVGANFLSSRCEFSPRSNKCGNIKSKWLNSLRRANKIHPKKVNKLYIKAGFLINYKSKSNVFIKHKDRTFLFYIFMKAFSFTFEYCTGLTFATKVKFT